MQYQNWKNHFKRQNWFAAKLIGFLDINHDI